MIIGLTDQRAKLPKLGTIRKGDVKTDPKKPGKDLDYFRFDTEDAEAKAIFEAVYGQKPRTIRVVLPYNTVGENWDAWKEHWVASSLKHRCNGEKTVIWQDKNGNYVTDPDKQIKCPGGCKQVGRLTVLLPELKRWSAVTVLTTSIHDIIELQGNLDSLGGEKGNVRGIPLLLRRVQREVSTPRDGGKKARVKKWLLNIEAQPQWFDIALSAAENAARALHGGVPMGLLNAAPVDAVPLVEEDDYEDEIESSAIDITVEPPAEEFNGHAPVGDRITQADCPVGLGVDAILIHWAIKEKKSEKAGHAYFDGVISRWTKKQKEAFASEKGLKWTDATIITVETDPAPDEIDQETAAALAEIQRISGELSKAGLVEEVIQQEIVRLMAPQDALTNCTPRELEQVIDGLNLKLDFLRK